MEILQAFGINGTAFIQFFIFITTFTFLCVFVFIPYVNAFGERENQTKGNEEVADEIKNKSLELHASYSEKAKEVHGSITEIFAEARGLANKDFEKIISGAKDEAAKILEDNRMKISASVQKASEQLKGESSQIALMVTHKMLGK